MFQRLFPETVDNRFRGHRVALWLFYPITLVMIVRSCIHMFRGDGGAQSIATIPLDSLTSVGVASVIAVFAQWGLSQLLLALLFAVVLLRYRALISLMYLVIVVENIGRIAMGSMKPFVTLETAPGGPGSFVFIALALVGFVLSLRWPQETQ